MTARTKEFFVAYAPDCRKRHSHKRVKNKVIEFAVQLEILIDQTWHPVIRYDTAHKFAHCDVLHWGGKKERLAIPTLDYANALTFADRDLNENWELHRNRFLKEASKNG